MQQDHTPITWLKEIAAALQWPAVVTAAFCLGRYVNDLEHRISKAESRLEVLVERHLPAVHRALAEIRGLLMPKR